MTRTGADDESPFPKASREDWERAAARVLGDRSPESLITCSEDGITVPPVSRDDAPPRPEVPARGGAVLACATVEDTDEAVAALDDGYDLARVCYDHDEQAGALTDLPLSRILLDPVEAVSATAALTDLPDAAGVVLGWWGWTHVVENATPAQQIGWILSAAVDVLTEADDSDGRRLVLEVPVGTHILTEIAKLRALRVLWREIAGERDLPASLRVLATCPSIARTRLDPESNLLRATLAGFAAVTGGADIVELAPYRDGAEAARLTLGQVRLMREEAALDAVADPLAGSGTIEHLTAALVSAGRDELARLRGLGGFLAVERDWNEERLERLVEPHAAPAAARAAAVAHRERVVVGINRFADPSRDRDADRVDDADEAFGAWCEDGADLTELAADGVTELEFLRERMLWHEDAGGERPRIVLLPLGPVTQRRARADFAADLLRAGGFVIDDAGGLDDADQAIARARGAAAAVVCSDDASYADLVPRIAEALPDTRVFVAGRGPADSDGWGADGFVHASIDAVAFLCALQDETGVRRRP